MGRRYDDVVHVRQEESGQRAPSAFVWRERLYVVREVLGHWHERTAWWEGAAALAVHGDDAPGPVGSGSVGTAVADAADQEVWRVTASAGQRASVGIYDLGRSGSTGWRLLRVVD